MATSTSDTIREAPPPRRLARLSVDLSAIRANWASFQRRAGAAEVAAVIKADAYGCGQGRVALALAEEGVRTFFVATLGEGVAAREALGDAHAIYVLNGPEADEIGHFRDRRLFPVLNSTRQVALWTSAGAPAAAALHIDTGMNRLGVPLAEADAARTALLRTDVPLVMSHLACSGTPAHPLNALQLQRFSEIAAHFPGARKSLAATAGAFIGRAYHFDMIRPGIGLYGDNDLETPPEGLRPAAAVHAPVLQVRKVGAGESVGYGATWAAQGEVTVATIALGYADGYLRAAAGRSYGVLAGVRCPVLGRVSMDLITLDVTAAGDAARPGAWVEMLGPQVPLRELAAAAGTNTYEVLTSFGRIAHRYGTLG